MLYPAELRARGREAPSSCLNLVQGALTRSSRRPRAFRVSHRTFTALKIVRLEVKGIESSLQVFEI